MRHDTSVKIGAGGMGDVFKAWDPDLERFIALKYLRYDDPELVDRLLREARAQARIDHPSVCEVYEVGEDDGRPYIAMQYVDGLHLNEAAADLSLEQKVLLVRQVAEAVQAAHSEGLIHRDLKPSNIMVSQTGDDQLRPFVLDFGIAREQAVPGVTVTGQVIGTPGYLSPEQARGETTTIDRRSDIFSLGTILYELIGGESPFSGGSDVEALVALLEKDPLPLRARAPQVPRDLEAVVMTCLEQNPDRRYPSAHALAEDLGRFLNGEPVEARRSSVIRRLIRRARRNKVASSLLLASALAVVGLMVVMLAGWVKYTADLRRERNVALEAQRIAEERESDTEEFARLLVSVFEAADPKESKGEEITAREILDQGAQRITTELADKPQIQARLMGVIGVIYTQLGLLDQAGPLLQQAVDTIKSQPDADEQALIDSYVRLADFHIRAGEFDEASALLQPIASTAEDALGPDHLQVALALDSLGRARISQGRYDEASALIGRALEIAKAAVGPENLETASIENDLAAALHRTGDYERSEELYRRALATRERELDPDDPRVATTLNNFGNLLRTTGRYEEAVPVLERALEIRTKVLDPHHSRIATTCNNLALAYKKLGQYEKSEAQFLRSLDIRERAYGPDHPRVGLVLLNLGSLYKATGNFEKSETSYVRAIGIYRSELPKHPNLASALNGYADLLRLEGQHAEAERLLKQALAIQQPALGIDHTATAKTIKTLGLAYMDQGRLEEAETSIKQALEIQKSGLGLTHLIVADTIFELARVYWKQGRTDEAELLFEEALKIERESNVERGSIQERYLALTQTR